MQEFTQTPAFFWLFWSLTTAFGVLVGWWIRMAIHERKLENQLEIRDQERQHLAHQIEQLHAGQNMKEADLKKAELDLARLQTKMEAFDRERNLHINAVESAARQMQQFQKQTDGFQSKIQVFEEQILGLRTRNAYLTGELNQRREEINAYKHLNLDFISLQKNMAGLEEAVSEIENEKNLAEHELEMAWVEIENLQTELIEKLPPNGQNCVLNSENDFENFRVAEADDLKIINGLTPFAEKILKENGVQNFEEIANWDAQKMQEMNALLGFYPRKIEKENWVGQAKHLIAV